VKAVVLREFGDPSVLRFEEIPTPNPQPGEVLIKVRNVSVNVTLDILLRKGLYPRKPPFPHVLGVDPTGEVAALGDGVTSHKVGDRVSVHTSLRSPQCVPGQESRDPGPDEMIGIHRWGGYAEFVAVPAENAFKIPDVLSFEEANVIMRHLPTARHLLHCDAGLQPGEWVLVMGASGGLASMCIQVAKRMGATVIGAAGSDDRVATGVEFGADHGINYRTQGLAEEVRKLTGGKGVEVVAENIGDPDLWPGAFDSLAKQGRLVTAGAHGGGQVTLNLQSMYLRRITIMGDPGCDFPDIDWAMEQAADGSIRTPLVDRVLPLHEAAEAHRLIESRDIAGKILLDPVASASVSTN